MNIWGSHNMKILMGKDELVHYRRFILFLYDKSNLKTKREDAAYERS